MFLINDIRAKTFLSENSLLADQVIYYADAVYQTETLFVNINQITYMTERLILNLKKKNISSFR